MKDVKETAPKKSTAKKAATKKAAEVKEEVKQEVPAPEVDKDAEINDLKAQIEQLKTMMLQQAQAKPQVIYSTGSTERVHFLWIANVSDDNVVEFGPGGLYGRVVGKTGSFFVPKDEMSRMLDSAARYYMNQRWLIVVDGLTEDEREAMGVNYKEGELLDVETFRKIAKKPKEELAEIYEELCKPHKEMVAARLHEEFEVGHAVDRETVKILNKIYPSVAFKDIIEKMNQDDLEE